MFPCGWSQKTMKSVVSKKQRHHEARISLPHLQKHPASRSLRLYLQFTVHCPMLADHFTCPPPPQPDTNAGVLKGYIPKPAAFARESSKKLINKSVSFEVPCFGVTKKESPSSKALNGRQRFKSRVALQRSGASVR